MTTGGIKVFRFEVMSVMLRSHLLHLLCLNGVFPLTYARLLLPEDVVSSVVAFFSLYFICGLALTVALMALNLDFITSTTAAVSALSNVGPGLGPAGNYSTLPDAAK